MRINDKQGGSTITVQYLPESLIYMRLRLKTTSFGGAFKRALDHSFLKGHRNKLIFWSLFDIDCQDSKGG